MREYRRLWRYLTTFLDRLPERCMPIIFMDGNAHIGYERGAEGVRIPVSDRLYGGDYPEMVNSNGTMFLEFLQHHRMCAANTFYPVGPTFFGPPPYCSKTRVDYIAIPQSRVRAIKSCAIPWPQAERLQTIMAPGIRDHVPVQMVIDIGLPYGSGRAEGPAGQRGIGPGSASWRQAPGFH